MVVYVFVLLGFYKEDWIGNLGWRGRRVVVGYGIIIVRRGSN